MSTYDRLITREKRNMPSINPDGRKTDKMVLPDDATFVPAHEAHEHGYHGISPDTTPRSEYTFDGQARKLTGGTKTSNAGNVSTGRAARSTEK